MCAFHDHPPVPGSTASASSNARNAKLGQPGIVFMVYPKRTSSSTYESRILTSKARARILGHRPQLAMLVFSRRSAGYGGVAFVLRSLTSCTVISGSGSSCSRRVTHASTL
jgi:hypothetical protein